MSAQQAGSSSSSNENISPAVVLSVAKEIRKLCTEPLDGIKVQLNEEDVTDIIAEIHGPDSTPFEGGVYKVKLTLPTDYPHAPPKGFFLTRIFHPNISKTGEICVNTLKKDWKNDLGIGHVLQVVRCLLINPFPESALNEEAGKLFMEDYDTYFKKARMFTEVHARAKVSSTNSAEAGEDCADGEQLEKRQKAADSKAAEKQRLAKKKSLKRL
ncbi:ubiquitin-conjugating enzyme e2 s-like protein [Chrysochromulina tobinii]|uniref:E2 ubiquitin-conjugating enzyme n=1 Tax=Chrysochromulina tobinii TaxID=1460289 RepID=A0A0M0J999_9EUKA|nr:ubiquitin-conjugating enzyme e2 s-like protein [Chrysochromulina tobinii]|eukprot:KOO23164.1 ubiquitin-conjugating enzyme e2 s-like protein [Chrysochromulina sp. CCMP291]